MRKKTIVAIALFLFISVLFVACSSDNPSKPTPTPTPTPTAMPTPEPQSIETPEPAPNPHELVWLVPPTLEFDHVVYCAHCDFFAVDDHSGRHIDRETGELTEEWRGGHGMGGGWVYDPERNLIGVEAPGPSVLFPFDELFEHHPQIRYYSLAVVAQVDSSMQEGSGGMEWLALEAFAGRYAVMSNGILVTDFLFDARNLMGEHIRHNTVALGQDGYWGLIGRDGEVALPFIFEHIVHDNNFAFARYNGRYGILDIRDIR